MYVLVCRLVAALRRRPFLLAISSNRSVYPPGVAGYSRVQSAVYRLALRTASRVIAQTRFQADMLVQHYGVRPERLVIIPNGAQDSALFAPNPPSTVGDGESAPPTIVWLATMHPYKGVEAVLELARRLPDYRFVIGGGPAHGSQKYYEEVAAAAAKLPNVHWRGFVTRDEVDHFMQGTVAFLNTTVARPDLPNLEGFPNVYLEAWRNGVPVLTLHNDPDGMIVDRRLGFTSGNIDQMAQDLRRLTEDGELRRKMGETARLYFQTHHHIAQCARQYAQLVDTLHRAG